MNINANTNKKTVKRGRRLAKTVLCAVLAFAAALTFTACGSTSVSYDNLDLKEYIKPGEYKGLTYKVKAVEVTDKEVNARIMSQLENSTSSEEIDESTPIENGDTVNIDYVGKMDGTAFEGGTAQGQDLTIGSNSYIDGFESGLVGHKVGETVDLNLTFPDPYPNNQDLAGKAVVFTVTINSATRETAPDLDDDYVQNITKYKTVQEYQDAVRKEILKEKKESAVADAQGEMFSKVLGDTEVLQYPEKIVNHYMKANSDRIDILAEQYGTTREEWLEQNEIGSEEEFEKVNRDATELRVKQEMLIEYIASEESLTYSDAEAEKAVSSLKDSGYDDESITVQTGRSLEEYVHIILLQDKVYEFLMDEGKKK